MTSSLDRILALSQRHNQIGSIHVVALAMGRVKNHFAELDGKVVFIKEHTSGKAAAKIDHPVIPDLIPLTPAAHSVLVSISRVGGSPLVVGGAVRDALLARQSGVVIKPKDVDIEAYGVDQDTLTRALSGVGKTNVVGKSFGVVKVAIGTEDFDVSLPRKDSKAVDTSGGHKDFTVQVDPDMSHAEAFGRRDFTINAIGWDPMTGAVVDPYHGVQDLTNGVLRHTSAAFGEDPLRPLRAVQFAGRLGFTVHPDTTRLSRSLVGEYKKLPKERVWEEWHKLVSKGTRPSLALDALSQMGWEKHYPELADLRGVQQSSQWHPEGDVYEHTRQVVDQAALIALRDHLNPYDRTVVVFAAMLHDVGKVGHTQLRFDGSITSHGHARGGVEPATSFLHSIGAPVDVISAVRVLVDEHMTASSIGDRDPTTSDVRRLMRRLSKGGATLTQWAAVCEADRRGRGTASADTEAKKWIAVASHMPPTQDVLRPILTGDHLIAHGMKPGPAFAPIMSDAVVAQDAGIIHDEPSALEWLRMRVNNANN